MHLPSDPLQLELAVARVAEAALGDVAHAALEAQAGGRVVEPLRSLDELDPEAVGVAGGPFGARPGDRFHLAPDVRRAGAPAHPQGHARLLRRKRSARRQQQGGCQQDVILGSHQFSPSKDCSSLIERLSCSAAS